MRLWHNIAASAYTAVLQLQEALWFWHQLLACPPNGKHQCIPVSTLIITIV